MGSKHAFKAFSSQYVILRTVAALESPGNGYSGTLEDYFIFHLIRCMAETEIAPLLRFFRALARESRLRLLGFLAQRARTVQELASLLGLTEPTTSHHLGLLREAGLITLRVEGNLLWYNFERSELAPLAKSVLSRQNVANWAGEARAEKPDRLIQNYLESDGRLRLIPASRKKRYPVLAWLAGQFDLDYYFYTPVPAQNDR